MVIVSLLLFAGTIVSWCVLPSSKTTTAVHEKIEAVTYVAADPA